MKRPRPAPLAAAAALLAVLAIAMLARTYVPSPAPPVPPAPSTAPSPLLEGRPLDLNRARAEDLELLPRIGPTLARRIVEDRELEGPFRSVDDLARVRGIGPRTLQGLRGLVTVEAR